MTQLRKASTTPGSSRGAALAPESNASQPRASILLVDDQPARLLTYEAILSGVGVQCVRALSGAEALARLLKQEFAVILLDVQMPEMDGFEVARLIREHPRLERTPIIFVTGVHVSQLDQLRGYEVGAIDYIAVPVVPEILRSKVALLVELHLRRSELAALNKALHETRARLEAEHTSAIADREAQLRAVFEHPDEVIAVLQAQRGSNGAVEDWVYRSANTNALGLLGFTREALIGRRLSEVLPPARVERGIAVCTQVLSTREPMRYESCFAGKDLLVTVYPGGEDTVISSGMDITARNRAEAALRANDRRNRALMENAPVAIAHNAMDGRFEYVNRAFCDLVGYTAEELRARTWQEITHPDDVERDRSLGARVLAGEIPHYTLEKRYVRKDGTHVSVELFGNFVLDDDGHPLQGVSIAIDNSERRRAQAALRHSQERLLIAKSAAQLGIFDWNVSTGIIQWDERTRELWGVKSDEPVTYEVFIGGIHPDDRPLRQASIDQALRPDADGSYAAVYRVVNRIDATTRWIEASGRAYAENGRPTRLVGTVRDVTEHELAEQKLRESDRRKDEFLAMLAHELRNPIAPISNAVEVLTRLLAHDEKARPLLAMIKRQSGHLSRILDDLLDVARITQGRIELRREVVSTAHCVELAVEAVQPLIRAKAHRLTVTRPGEPVYVSADKVRIEQCLANLLTNAAKYTDAGGEIHTTVRVEAGQAVIEIADTGVGIAAEFLPRVFDLFAQSERSLDRSQGGLGIGLSICKRLVEMHGGSVACSSAGVGHGATFTIRLPLLSQHFDSAPTSSAAASPNQRLLIVDDNHDAADSLAMILQLDGHQTMTVYCADSALQQVIAFDPQIVLLDIGLPRMDGYELARRLKALIGSVRLIALSGYGQAEDRQRSAAAGFEAHMTKPVDIDALKALLDPGRKS
jgi:PAS domain S-box-containing protein